MATPSRFSLTGWNSTYIAPRTIKPTAPAVPAAATTPAGTSAGSIGSMTADIPAALQGLVSNANQSDAVRALSQALNLAISQGGAAGGNQADLITALSQAQQRNQVWDTIMKDRQTMDWQRQKANRADLATVGGPLGWSDTYLGQIANKQADLDRTQLDYLRTMSANWLNPLTASSIAPHASLGSAPMSTSGWVSRSLVR